MGARRGYMRDSTLVFFGLPQTVADPAQYVRVVHSRNIHKKRIYFLIFFNGIQSSYNQISYIRHCIEVSNLAERLRRVIEDLGIVY